MANLDFCNLAYLPLMKILETEEMNVDLRYLDLSSLHYFCTG